MTEQTTSGVRRTVISCVLVSLLLATGFGSLYYLASLRSQPPSRKEQLRVYQVDLYRVEPQPLQEVMTAFGTARSDHQVVLAAQVAGEIVSVHPQLRVGLRIPPQQSESRPVVLVEIDPQAFQQKVTQAQRRLDEDAADLARQAQDVQNNRRLLEKARQDLAVYRKEYERIRGLQAKGVATESDVTKATLELRRYDDQVITLENQKELLPLEKQKLLKRKAVHEADLALTRLDLGHATVQAPFSGVLGEVHVEQGQYVRAGEPLVRLVDDSRIEIPVSLTVTDYQRVRGMLDSGRVPGVELAGEATGSSTWTGRVARLAPEVDERTRTGRAFIVVENRSQPRPLVPGTFVHARIAGEELDHAIVIPRDAIAVDADGQQFVWVMAGQPVSVDSGAQDESAIQARKIERRRLPADKIRTFQTLALVAPGVLSKGELVVLTNLDVLADESLVRVPDGDAVRTLDNELSDQGVTVLRRTDSPAGESDSGKSID